MRYLGKIVRWNDERGFGFIQDAQNGKEYFVHISAFPAGQPRPEEGEEVSFTVIHGKQDKLAAADVEYVNRPQIRPVRHSKARKAEEGVSSGGFPIFFGLLLALILAAGYSGFQYWQHRKMSAASQVSVAEVAAKMQQERQEEKERIVKKQAAQIPQNVVDEANRRAKNMKLSESSSRFKCDGRRRCPQMSSCEEAKYFLENCPGVEMDGDGDGIPCEEQWCGH